MKTSRTMIQLFLSYILFIVPAMIISFLIANILTGEIEKQLKYRIDNKILKIEQDLNNKFDNLKNNAVRISTIEQLSPDKFIDRGGASMEGIEYLGNIRMMDNFKEDIFLYYDGEIFTSQGYSRPETYLGITLNCTENAVELGRKILQEKSATMVYLPSADSGNLLLHYPVQSIKQVYKKNASYSINYCVDNDIIYSLFEAVMEQMNFLVQITFENEWQTENVFLTGDGNTKIYDISLEEYNALQDKGDWETREINLLLWKIKLLVSYDVKEMYGYVHFLQMINMLSMGVLLLFSLGISYWISKKQYNKIYQLRQSLQTMCSTDAGVVRENSQNEFDYMHSMIQSIVQETGCTRLEINSARTLMKKQGAMLLFYGGIREKNAAIGMLESCEIELQEPFFAVACITGKKSKNLLLDKLSNLTEDKLSCVGSVGGKSALIVLLELSSEDFMKNQRKKFVDALLAETDEEIVIAFSRPYESILYASDAYLEAAGICGRLQQSSGEYVGFADTWIDVREQMIRFEEAELLELKNAISDGERLKAQKVLEGFLEFIQSRSLSLSEENKKYLRYSIIQSVLISSKNLDSVNISAISEEIAGIDLNDDSVVEKKLWSIFNQLCPAEAGEEREKIDFALIVEYISRNFQRYDLSLEEVADFAHLSKAYLSRLFKIKTGSKYIDYLTACRMEQAKRLLVETEMSVKDIAEAVGYCNVPGFRNKFKNYYGVNASEIRRKGNKTDI